MSRFNKGDRVKVTAYGRKGAASRYAGLTGVVVSLPDSESDPETGIYDTLYAIKLDRDPDTWSDEGLPCLESELEPDDAA